MALSNSFVIASSARLRNASGEVSSGVGVTLSSIAEGCECSARAGVDVPAAAGASDFVLLFPWAGGCGFPWWETCLPRFPPPGYFSAFASFFVCSACLGTSLSG